MILLACSLLIALSLGATSKELIHTLAASTVTALYFPFLLLDYTKERALISLRTQIVSITSTSIIMLNSMNSPYMGIRYSHPWLIAAGIYLYVMLMVAYFLWGRMIAAPVAFPVGREKLNKYEYRRLRIMMLDAE